ncbi:hypothetical protein B0H19DRAFT_1264853 [Mycena capillaripes]|nr:hypothetical protein B0H19DRAFT_1264853 [Mycena capillaripes]
MAIELYQRIAAADKEVLNNLRMVGFKLNMRMMDTGLGLIPWERARGTTSVDVGSSHMFINGKINIKNDS